MKHSIIDIRPECFLIFMKLVLLFLVLILAKVSMLGCTKLEHELVDQTNRFLSDIEKSLEKMETGPSIEDIL